MREAQSPIYNRIRPGDRGVSIPSRGHHIAFAVDDFDRALAIARATGTPIASGPQSRPNGPRQLYLYDPDVEKIFAGNARELLKLDYVHSPFQSAVNA